MGLTHNSRPSDSKCPSDELHLSLSMRVLGTRYGHSNHHRRPSARTVADTQVEGGQASAAAPLRRRRRRRRQRRVVVVAVGVVAGVGEESELCNGSGESRVTVSKMDEWIF